MLMEFPKMATADLIHADAILQYGADMVRHYNEQLKHYRDGLELVSKIESPLLQTHILNDGKIYAKGHVGEITERIEKAQNNAVHQLNKFYWDELHNALAEKVYGGAIAQDIQRFFKHHFSGYMNETYLDFDSHTVNAYIKERLFCPMYSNTALSLIEDFTKILRDDNATYILKDHRLDIKNLAFHSYDMNRFVTQDDFLIALILYVNKDKTTDELLTALDQSNDAIYYSNKERWGSEIGRNFDGDRFYIKGRYLEQYRDIAQQFQFVID